MVCNEFFVLEANSLCINCTAAVEEETLGFGACLAFWKSEYGRIDMFEDKV